MASSEQQSPTPAPPAYADRAYRSGGAIAGGALALALALWLGGDVVFTGHGHAPWLALAAMLLVIPVIIGYTVRPAVFAGADRIRIRNPFRTITVPWGAVREMRARFSTELFTKDDVKYQMWAIAVSLRQRKRADRKLMRAERSTYASSPTQQAAAGLSTADHEVRLAMADQALGELRDLKARGEERPEAQGAPVVRWAYEVIGPAVAGGLLLIVLLIIGG